MKSKIVESSIVLEQPEDCCGRTGNTHQFLEIETADGGGGPYLVIKTERWAIDEDGIEELLARFRRLLGTLTHSPSGDLSE